MTISIFNFVAQIKWPLTFIIIFIIFKFSTKKERENRIVDDEYFKDFDEMMYKAHKRHAEDFCSRCGMFLSLGSDRHCLHCFPLGGLKLYKDK